jgi:hypothetical protein
MTRASEANPALRRRPADPGRGNGYRATVRSELADQIAEELPGQLGTRIGDVNWRVQVAGAERADATPTSEALRQAVRRRMQDEGWDLAVALTDLPLRANRRPVTAHASAMYRVGLLSVPALGARSVARRAMRAVLNLVEGLLGEEVGSGSDADETGRAHRMRQRLDELQSPLGPSRAGEDGTIAFSVQRCGATCGCSSAWSARTSLSASSLVCRARWRCHSAPPHTR